MLLDRSLGGLCATASRVYVTYATPGVDGHELDPVPARDLRLRGEEIYTTTLVAANLGY